MLRTDRSGRLLHVDLLRSFALLGILFVNLTWFTGFAVTGPGERATLAADGVVATAIHALFDGKFYSLFALLFGIGVALQERSAAARGRSFGPVYARRLVWLLVIGALHACLWFGDILSLYAVTGALLFVFLRSPAPRLLLAAGACLLAPIALSLVWLFVPAAAAFAAPPQGGEHGPAQLVGAFGHGTLQEVLGANRVFLEERWKLAVYSGRFAKLLGLFLLGMASVRSGLIQHPERHRRWLVALLSGGLAIGLPLTALETWRSGLVATRPPSLDGCLQLALSTLGTPALSLAYASGCLLVVVRLGSERLRAFSWVGRMSLTCYLTQTLVSIALFYGMGLGLWGRVAVSWVPLLAVLAFVVQSLFAAAWLQRFRYGPAEWLWRSLAQARLLPLRMTRAGGPSTHSAQ